jgi:hypothetical protein
MIVPRYESSVSYLRPWTEHRRLMYQVREGKVRIGPDAAREIAKRIERQHGFWDYPQQGATA